MQAHRYAYERTHGPIPPGPGWHGWCVCHRCDNPRCVRPDHLFLGTAKDNVNDAADKLRMPHGPTNWMTKLTADQVRAMRAEYAEGKPSKRVTYQAIADRYGVSMLTAYDAIKRRSWKHVA